MKFPPRHESFRLVILCGFLICASAVAGLAQPSRPLLQPIVVVTENTQAKPAATPLITKTASAAPVVRKSPYEMLATAEIPGYSGVLIEGLDDRQVILESNSAQAFNPASNVKVATAFAVLKTFGPDYRFPTQVWTDGQVDNSTGTLYGNLYVSGRDPIFNYEHAVSIANELNRLGIREVTGDLIVTGDFVMNFSASAERSGGTLQATLDPAKRSSAATVAWNNYVANSRRFKDVVAQPGVFVAGGMYVQSVPTNAKLLFSHESAPMRAIVKATLCYSNNFLSERLGDMLGGPSAVARTVHQNAMVAPGEFILATSSGLGANRVTPRAMMALLRALRTELVNRNMTFADIMPVAGVDRGTLEGRFDSDFARGSVVGKTGTLGNTDGGVSSLCGEIQTRTGKVLFVIFNQQGGVRQFRNFQNNFVSLVQGQMGGAAPLGYQHIPIDIRLATSRITYPNQRSRVE